MARLPDFMDRGILPRAVGAAVLVIGALAALSSGWWMLVEADRATQARERLALAQAAAAPESRAAAASAAPAPARSAARPPRPAAAERTDKARELNRWLEVDWSARLVGVEHAFDDGVTLLGFRLDGQKGVLELRGEAHSLERIEALRAELVEAGVPRVTLVRHETAVRDERARIAFTMVLEWA